jgi:hypothetical protein
MLACSDKKSSQAITVSELEIAEAITGSDDYKKHKNNFVKSTKQLVQSGKCSISEFKDIGGWVKSEKYKKEPIYFTYCGGMKLSNKIYVNALTGDIYK